MEYIDFICAILSCSTCTFTFFLSRRRRHKQTHCGILCIITCWARALSSGTTIGHSVVVVVLYSHKNIIFFFFFALFSWCYYDQNIIKIGHSCGWPLAVRKHKQTLASVYCIHTYILVYMIWTNFDRVSEKINKSVAIYAVVRIHVHMLILLCKILKYKNIISFKNYFHFTFHIYKY